MYGLEQIISPHVPQWPKTQVLNVPWIWSPSGPVCAFFMISPAAFHHMGNFDMPCMDSHLVGS